MDVVVARCAGLDVHKDTVVACVRTPGSGRAAGRAGPHVLGPPPPSCWGCGIGWSPRR